MKIYHTSNFNDSFWQIGGHAMHNAPVRTCVWEVFLIAQRCSHDEHPLWLPVEIWLFILRFLDNSSFENLLDAAEADSDGGSGSSGSGSSSSESSGSSGASPSSSGSDGHASASGDRDFDPSVQPPPAEAGSASFTVVNADTQSTTIVRE